MNKNKPSERKINSCNLEGEEGLQSISVSSSRSGVDGKVGVSSWNLSKVGKGNVVSEGNDNVAWSCKNGGWKVAGGLSNYFSL